LARSEQPPDVEREVRRQAAPDHSHRPCGEAFNHFYVGQALAGRELVHRQVACTEPKPVRTRAAGGEIDPRSLVRAHSVSYIYGTCKATSELGCAPPLDIQTWPACERSPADYSVAGEPLKPSEVLELRGVPARFYGDDRLELSTGALTIVFFGDSRDLLLAAAEELRTTASSPRQIDSRGPLPPPVPG
jgi:hypothetical protein